MFLHLSQQAKKSREMPSRLNINLDNKSRNLTATNSSKMLTSNRFIADSEAIKGFASAPEYPAE